MGSGVQNTTSSQKNPKSTSKESSRKRKKNKLQAKSKRRRHDSTDSPPSSSSDPSSDTDNGESRVRKKESGSRARLKRQDEPEKRAKQSKSHRSRVKSKRRKLDSGKDGSERGRPRKREKHRRRDLSASSSCSTCRSPSSSEENRRRGKNSSSKKPVKKRDKRNRGRYRSPSCSTCSGGSRSSRSCRSERFAERTRSRDISSARGSKERESRHDNVRAEERAEITQDYADFPSSRSNDSLSGGASKRERRIASVDLPEKKRVEDNTRDAADDARIGEDVDEGDGMPYSSGDGSLPSGAQAEERSSVRVKSKIVVPSVPAETDDLELILRQKALENLKMFRGRLSGSASHLVDAESCRFSGGQVETDQNLEVVDMGAKQKPIMSSEENFQPECRGKIIDNPPVGMPTDSRNSERFNENQFTDQHDTKAGSQPASTKSSLSSASFLKKQLSPNQPPKEEEFLENAIKEASYGRTVPESEAAKGPDSSIAKFDIGEGSTSTPSVSKTYAEQNRTNKPQNEARTDSELEKKTMTVMRGGEMVEVSYKVYIPKKSPALARRQLKR